jgi:hypothetical protein
MRDIRASAEVADMIGAENLHRLRHSPAYGPFTCWHCHGPGDANTEPATVIAELGPGDAYTEPATVIAELHDGARIALAHAECARSQVVSTSTPAPAALTEPGTGADMAALTGVLAGPDGPLPLLILDHRPEMIVRSGPAERVNPFVSTLLGMGLTLVTTISEQLAQAMDGQAGALAHAQAAGPEPSVLPPGPAPGWRLELSARRAARLTAPDGSVIYGGECGQPRPWRALISRTDRCAVLIGAIGLNASPGERAPTRITTLLDQAAHAEELVGGLVEAC